MTAIDSHLTSPMMITKVFQKEKSGLIKFDSMTVNEWNVFRLIRRNRAATAPLSRLILFGEKEHPNEH